MARWQIADEDYYWPISFKTRELAGDPEFLKAIGIPEAEDEMNLWRCRHCGAMVPGDGRTMHTYFHRATNTLFIDVREVE